MVACSLCGKVVFAVFRDRPTGQRCKWVCYSCLSEDMKKEARATMDELAESDMKLHFTG